MFNCPKCNGKTRVYSDCKNNKPLTYGRHRKCTVCGLNFKTVEYIADEIPKYHDKGYQEASTDVAEMIERKRGILNG